LPTPALPHTVPHPSLRYFLDNVAGWILELDRGSGIPFEGNYSGGQLAGRREGQVQAQQQTHHTYMVQRTTAHTVSNMRLLNRGDVLLRSL
jgi:ATPase subunit of ABC transporter with duplicated ATPase domains